MCECWECLCNSSSLSTPKVLHPRPVSECYLRIWIPVWALVTFIPILQYDWEMRCLKWAHDWFTTTVFVCLSDGSETIPKVTEVIPKYGSINGATRLTIKGEGMVAPCWPARRHPRLGYLPFKIVWYWASTLIFHITQDFIHSRWALIPS